MHKVGGILIRNRALLVTKSKNKEVFIAPGGKITRKETPTEALIRELAEELGISVLQEHLEIFGLFYAPAAGNEQQTLRMDVFFVKKWSGKLSPNNEVEQILWLTSHIPEEIKVGSIFEHEVIPRLKKENLID